MAIPGALDQEVGNLIGTLPDGTEFRQARRNPQPGDSHTTPDGRSWTAVHEQLVAGVVSRSPFTIHWKLILPTRIRRSANNLPQWDPILLWYSKAVRQMKTRPITDPTSWRYQAAIHDYTVARDPFKVAGEPVPSAADQSKFWSRCQHGSWYFLPWHRAYLLYFERMVAATIVSLGGPAGWALPYWNYSDPANANARKLPFAFQQAKLPDGTPNALLVASPNRAPAANSNLLLGSAGSADISVCLAKDVFTNAGVVSKFGGGQTGFSHGGGVAGACEITPHGSMHVAVGGPSGWMSAFDTAALDPIFWLHHSNIDRLWELWRRQVTTHLDPTSALWATGVKFDFHDEQKAAVTITASQMVDLSSAMLNYDYEGLPPKPPSSFAPMAEVEGVSMAQRQIIPEMVGATSGSVTLGSEPGRANLTIAAPTGPASFAPGAAPATQRNVNLVLENVQAPAYPIESYEVYVNLPENANPEEHKDLMAGILPHFGIVEASQPGNEHGGAGVNVSFDITGIVTELETRGAWDPAQLKVSFFPLRTPGDRETEMVMAPVRVGRVSLYFS